MTTPKLKSNPDVKDFCDVTASEWASLKSCNMLDKFYPFTKGVLYNEDCALYAQAKSMVLVKTAPKTLEQSRENTAAKLAKINLAKLPQSERPAKKPFAELCRTDYEKLYKLGILWVAYPEASGNYDVDFPPKPKQVNVYLHSDRDHMREVGKTLGLTGDALRHFETELYEVVLNIEVDMVTGGAKILQVDGDNVERFV